MDLGLLAIFHNTGLSHMFCNSCVWAYLLWEFNFLGVPRHSCLPVKHFRINPQVHGSQGFPGGTSGKEPACQCRRHERPGLIPESGRSPGGRHCNPLQYSCLENPVDRGTWQARVEKHQTQLKQLRTHTRTLTQSDHGVMTWLFTHWWSSHACWWFPSRPLMQRDSAPSYRQPWVCLGPWIHKSCLNCCSFGHWTLPPLLQVPKGNLLKV